VTATATHHRATSSPAADRPRKRKPSRRSSLLTLSMLAFLVYFLLPLFWLVVAATKGSGDLFNTFGLWFGHDFHLFANIRSTFTYNNGVYGRWLLNTLFYAVASAGGAALLATLGGYGFAKFRFPGRNLIFFAIIGILMVPFQSVVVPLYLWVSRLGLLDTYLGILAPDLVSVFGVFLMRQSIEVVPNDYIDAARIDGSSELGIFWRVILPAVRPALATLLIIKFMWTWNELFWPLVVINSPTMKVVTMGLVSFTNIYFIEYNLVTAAAVVSILPILAVFLLCQRWVVQAVVMSGLKG